MKKRAEIHWGLRRRCVGPLKEAGYTSAIVITEPDLNRPLQSGGVHIRPHTAFRFESDCSARAAESPFQVRNQRLYALNQLKCGRGGIGRRAALRSLWGNTRGSSSLLDRTTFHHWGSNPL